MPVTRAIPENPRSKDLVAMEEELNLLLRHSNLNPVQRREFLSLLHSIFDLFLTPVQKNLLSKANTNRGFASFNGLDDETVALIDLPIVELFSKMQNLVSSLTSLIMNEDEENSTTMFLEEQQQETQTPILTRSHYGERYGDLNRNNSPSLMVRRSPSFNSRNLPEFKDHKQSITNSTYQHQSQTARRTSGLSFQNDRFQEFKVVNTPVPRTFSTNNRPQSMFASGTKNDLLQTPTPKDSPTLFNRSESGGSNNSSGRKRYSMRF